MSNYTDNNLIVTTAPNNARAIKIGNKIFTGFYDASASSMNFYKCSSVDTSNSTWTGYLTSVDPITGAWSFAETATTGLTYDRLIPMVGQVYDETGSRLLNLLPLDDSVVFYAPLRDETTTPTGQALSETSLDPEYMPQGNGYIYRSGKGTYFFDKAFFVPCQVKGLSAFTIMVRVCYERETNTSRYIYIVNRL